MFPEAFTDGALDLNKLAGLLGESTASMPSERFGLSWVGKGEAVAAAQSPATGTLRPQPEASISFSSTENTLICGDNLEVLKHLLKSYYGSAKMIYIDPPYNRDNEESVYPDNFRDPLRAYLRYTGQITEEGTLATTAQETAGRVHSRWLTDMYPRLFLALHLLSDDGVIFISIDDTELSALRMVMDEIFGEENFVAQVTVQTNPRGRTLNKFLATTHEYVLIYARNAQSDAIGQIPKDASKLAEYDHEDEHGKYRELELRNRNPIFNRLNREHLYYPIYVHRSTGAVALEPAEEFEEVFPKNTLDEDGCWTWGKPKAAGNLSLLVGRQVRTGAWRVFRKDYLPKDGVATTKAKTIWLDKAMNHENGKEELGRLFGKSPFSYPKSVELVKQCVSLGTSADGGDLVLDFFAGSGTTAQAVLELNRVDGGNRRFMCVQLPEPNKEGSVALAAGYATIFDTMRERIARVIQRMRSQPVLAADKEDLGFAVFTLDTSCFKIWDGSRASREARELGQQMLDFAHNLQPERSDQDILYELMLRNGVPLTARVKEISLKPGRAYAIAENELVFCLEASIDAELADRLWSLKPKRLVCLDHAFRSDESLRANLGLQMKAAGTIFQTI